MTKNEYATSSYDLLTGIMNYFKKLEGFQRSPAGLEWVIWKKLHLILMKGPAYVADAYVMEEAIGAKETVIQR